MTIKEKLIELKKTNPIFKDYDFKMYNNDLTGIVDHIYLLRKQKEIEELNESNKNTEKSSK